MKSTIKMSLFALSLTLVSLSSRSQEEDSDHSSTVLSFTSAPHPKWVSDKGFWVVEKNIHTPGQSTLYFYNNKKELVYKETVEGVLKLNKKKTLMQIKRTLETVAIAWEKGQPVSDNLFAAAKGK
jgi:hypothetical protein